MPAGPVKWQSGFGFLYLGLCPDRFGDEPQEGVGLERQTRNQNLSAHRMRFGRDGWALARWTGPASFESVACRLTDPPWGPTDPGCVRVGRRWEVEGGMRACQEMQDMQASRMACAH